MKKFKKIYIEITNRCNLACTFCPATRRKGEFMNISNFSEVLDCIKPYGEYIYLHVKGEPLLHPKIDKLLDLGGQKGFKVNITTNGTLIHQVKDKILLKPALRQINFSLHSFEGNKEYINMDKYINNILSFVKESTEKTNTLISLRLWNLSKDNAVNTQMEKNRNILKVIEREFQLPYKIEEKIIPGRGMKLRDKIYLNQDHEFKWPDLNAEEDEGKGFCYGLRNQIAILVDGTVVPCCLDGEGVINLGNIYNTPFSEILENHRAKDIINGFSNRKAVEELCKKCGYRQKFGI